MSSSEKWRDFNINNSVRIKLNREGIHKYYQYFEEVGIVSEGPKIDFEGWTEMQLWQVMAIFGDRMYLSADPLFATIIQIKSSDLRQAQENKV